ncbi:hypothetical protein G4228_017714 [Cervus hanglu yarkandensis]|nr:hypothetical protein G4228_017714 [Cervus hanglu yarkandensis]
MASRRPAVGASLRRRSLQNQERLEESKALQPVAGHPDTSSGALGSLCRQFQRRLPLTAVSLNLGEGPSWKHLETPEPGQQGLQAAARSAKSTLGAMSQRIQESCQSGTKWLVETQVKAKRRKRGAQKGSSPPSFQPELEEHLAICDRPCPLIPGPLGEIVPLPLCPDGPPCPPLATVQEGGCLPEPYSSAEPLCSPSKSDSDLESVGAGIRHLQVSQELDEAIVAEDSGDMTFSHPRLRTAPFRIHTSQEFLEDPGAGGAPELPQTRT